MQTRVISFFEIEERMKDLILELESTPLDKESVLEKGQSLPFLLHLSISQMQSTNSKNYPGKEKHYEILKRASESITYKMNDCTITQIQRQINEAFKAFGIQ